MILVISQPDGSEVLRTDIGDHNPNRVTVAVLTALDNLPKPRAKRSDAGKPRVAGKGDGNTRE